MSTKRSITIVIAFIIGLTLAVVLNTKLSKTPNVPLKKSGDDSMRIISLTPNITEILFALGLGDNIVGVTNHCNFPPQAQSKTKVGSSFQINSEAILLLSPTIAFAMSSTPNHKLKSKLDNIGCKSVSLRIEQLSEIYSAIEIIAKTCNVKEKGRELIASIKTNLEKVTAHENSKPRPKVLFVVQQEPLIVAGKNTYINELIEMVGAKNAVSGTDLLWPQLSKESLLLFAPDVIIQTTLAENVGDESWKSFYERWKMVPAVENNKVFAVNADKVSVPGPRVIEAAQIIHSIIYGDDTIKESQN